MYHLDHVLSTKPAEMVQEACQVLEKHGWHVKKLRSELYYSSTLCQVVFHLWASTGKRTIARYA